MSFALDLDTKKQIEVVVIKDSSLNMTRAEYEHYLQDVTDKSRLKFKEGKSFADCTLFVMRLVLPYKATKGVVAEQVSIEVRGKDDITPRVSFAHTFEEFRAALIDIKDPAKKLEFKKHSDGLASQELVAGIYHAGVMGDLLDAWRKAKGDTDGQAEEAVAAEK